MSKNVTLTATRSIKMHGPWNMAPETPPTAVLPAAMWNSLSEVATWVVRQNNVSVCTCSK